MNKKYCPISNSHELLCLQFKKEEEEEESEEDEGKGRKYRGGGRENIVILFYICIVTF